MKKNLLNKVPPRKMKKQKIIEILITAVISAGIAFLQSLLAQHLNAPKLESNPDQAGIIGLSIASIKNYKHFL